MKKYTWTYTHISPGQRTYQIFVVSVLAVDLNNARKDALIRAHGTPVYSFVESTKPTVCPIDYTYQDVTFI